MKKISALLILFFLSMHLFAIQITVKPDKDRNISVSSIEKDAFKDYVKKMMHFILLDEGAYRLVKENRALADEYLRQKKLNRYDIARLKVEAELYLAKKFVDSIQRKIKIPEKVVYSYYIDNKEKFKNEDMADIVLFFFKNYEDAAKFYENAKNHDFAYAKKLMQQFHGKMKEYGYKKISSLKSPTKEYIQKYKKSGIFFPPVILSPDSVSVLYVREYKKGKGYKPYEEVKEDIEKFLYNQTFLRERAKILKQYGIEK